MNDDTMPIRPLGTERNGHAKPSAGVSAGDDPRAASLGQPSLRGVRSGGVAAGPYLTRAKTGEDGAVYAASIPARSANALDSSLERVLTRIAEDFPWRAALVRQCWADAVHATDILNALEYRLGTEHDARQQETRRASDGLSALVLSHAESRQQVNQAHLEALEYLDREIERLEERAMHAEAQTLRQSGGSETSSPAHAIDTLEDRQDALTPKPSKGKVGLGLFLKAVNGAVIGLAAGENLKFLRRDSTLELEPEALPWVGLFGLAGMSIVYAVSEGIQGGFANAGERAAMEGTPGFLSSRALRHTLPPILLAGGFCLVEASLLRNAQVASPLVRDPANWTYLLGNLAFILPVTVQAAVTGWRAGRERGERKKLALPRVQAEADALVPFVPNEEERKEDYLAAREAKRESGQMQVSGEAIRTRIGSLEAKRQEVLAAMAEADAPFQRRLALATATMETEDGLTQEERELLETARADASAANERFMEEVRLCAEAFEPLPPRIRREGVGTITHTREPVKKGLLARLFGGGPHVR